MKNSLYIAALIGGYVALGLVYNMIEELKAKTETPEWKEMIHKKAMEETKRRYGYSVDVPCPPSWRESW